ncbi:hypothetical protein M885DRAFT_175379 [Pelagophyceae sp. CCMP2097]|nr:hypothetical protein M885DRAFT_175379 [Pelagophyceae sp. CCMP2097]
MLQTLRSRGGGSGAAAKRWRRYIPARRVVPQLVRLSDACLARDHPTTQVAAKRRRGRRRRRRPRRRRPRARLRRCRGRRRGRRRRRRAVVVRAGRSEIDFDRVIVCGCDNRPQKVPARRTAKAKAKVPVSPPPGGTRVESGEEPPPNAVARATRLRRTPIAKRYFNTPLSGDAGGADNLWTHVSAAATPADDVVVKLDIDKPQLEQALASAAESGNEARQRTRSRDQRPGGAGEDAKSMKSVRRLLLSSTRGAFSCTSSSTPRQSSSRSSTSYSGTTTSFAASIILGPRNDASSDF